MYWIISVLEIWFMIPVIGDPIVRWFEPSYDMKYWGTTVVLVVILDIIRRRIKEVNVKEEFEANKTRQMLLSKYRVNVTPGPK